MIARVMPGLGNPLLLDIGDFNAFLGKVGTVLQLERGDMTFEDQVKMDSGIE